jgi:uncharacterized membrane protein
LPTQNLQMNRNTKDNSDVWQPEPRWHALLAVIAVSGLYFALPDNIIIEPKWLYPSIVTLLLLLLVITHAKRFHGVDRKLGFALNTILTLGMIVSVARLIDILTDPQKLTPLFLMRSAGLLWITNVIVFALWYWRLDAGGPHRRERIIGHQTGAFLFPQMTMPPEEKQEAGKEDWSPNFIDYLFISFNTSTAFSPTDVPVLDRWAKILMMIQSVISLTVIALLLARAVNTLAVSGN